VLAMPVARVLGEGAKPYLGAPSLGSVIECSKFINKVWFQWVETILNMELVLDPLPLSMKELFNISHEVGAFGSSVADHAAFGADFVDSLVSTLYPNMASIIQTKHETCNEGEPGVHPYTYAHESYIARDVRIPVNSFINTKHLAHLDNQVRVLVFQWKAMELNP
jgi:hypothetical protein